MKLFKNLYHLNLNGMDNVDYFTFRKQMIVIVFFYIASFVLVSFMFVNFFLAQYSLSLIDFIAAIISFYSIYLLRKKENLQKIITISSINLFFFFLFYIFINQNLDFGLIWTIFLPIFIIPLNGYKKGLIISLIFYFFAGIIAYNGIGVWENGAWNMHAYIRFMVASFVLVYIIFVTEVAIYRSNLLLAQKEEEGKKYIEELKRSAERDYLTQIYNRRKITQILRREIARSKRYGLELSVAIIDIDFFKHINDTYGHNIGDSVLQEFAKKIEKNIRTSDFIGRWGGEEFIVILTHTPKEEAFQKVEQLCKIIREGDFRKVKRLTCSAGVHGLKNKDNMLMEELIAQADKALYGAKKNGRDQVQMV